MHTGYILLEGLLKASISASVARPWIQSITGYSVVDWFVPYSDFIKANDSSVRAMIYSTETMMVPHESIK